MEKPLTTFRFGVGCADRPITRDEAARHIRAHRASAKIDPGWYSLYVDHHGEHKIIILYEPYDNSAWVSIHKPAAGTH